MKLGKTDIEISRIGLGTWSIGGGPAWAAITTFGLSRIQFRRVPSWV